MFGNLGDPRHLGQQLASKLIGNNPTGYLADDTCGQLRAATQRIIRGLGNASMSDSLQQEFMTQVMSAAFERFAMQPGVVGNYASRWLAPSAIASHSTTHPHGDSSLATSEKVALQEVSLFENSARIYQSGEPIPVSGVYGVVGASVSTASQLKENAIRNLHSGEDFPVYGGEEVCWHFFSRDGHDPA